MNEVLDEIVKLGSKMKRMYKKRTAAAKEELPRMAAELGIFLVASSKKIARLKGEQLRTELDKVQKRWIISGNLSSRKRLRNSKSLVVNCLENEAGTLK